MEGENRLEFTTQLYQTLVKSNLLLTLYTNIEKTIDQGLEA